MDIEREREAFEALTSIHHCIYNADLNYYFSGSKFIGNKAEIEVNAGWCTWQAAKAQADQKIKLLLCDEHLKKCESPAGVFNSQYPDEEPCLICLVKEAKAQAIPDGFVVVSQKDLLELTIAINAVDLATHTESKTNEVREMWQQVAIKLMALGTTQEPAND